MFANPLIHPESLQLASLWTAMIPMLVMLALVSAAVVEESKARIKQN
jgi:hypothetical protein